MPARGGGQTRQSPDQHTHPDKETYLSVGLHARSHRQHYDRRFPDHAANTARTRD